MSLYKYPSMHGLKDIAMIYNDDEWDNAKIVVWDPEYQREYNISFTGSSRPSENEVGKVHFNITRVKDEKSADEEAIDKELDEQFPNLSQLEKNKYELIFRRGVEYGKNVIKKELLKEMYKSPCESCGNYMMSDDCVCNKLYKYCDFIKEVEKRTKK